MKVWRIVSLVVLIITATVSVDLLINYLGNLVPEMNDGLGIRTVLLPGWLIFGDSLWSLRRFFDAFVTSAWITLAVLAENIVLAIVDRARR